MESSRPCWIRPMVATLVILAMVGLVMGSALGREAPPPRPQVTPIEPPRTPTSVPGPAAVELREPERQLAAGPTTIAEPHRKARTGNSRARSKPKPEPEPASVPSLPSPAPTPVPTPVPTAAAPVVSSPLASCAAQPTPATGLLAILRDGRINESSGLATSARFPDLAFTMNDEGASPLVFAVQPSTGQTVGAFDLQGAGEFKDPESIRTDANGRLWLADTGDGHPGKSGKKHDKPERDAVVIAVFDDPGPQNGGTVPALGYSISYSDGPQNVEALLIHPVTNQAYLISNDEVGHVYALPNPLVPGRNVASLTDHLMPGFVTDATFTADGRLILVRTMNTPEVLIFDATSWLQVGQLSAPPMEQGESIAVEPGGQTVLLGSEGENSPLIRVALPPGC
jgi:hypothetical protein